VSATISWPREQRVPAPPRALLGLETDSPPEEPVELLLAWLAGAEELQVREPTALALATVDAHACVSNRIVRVEAVTSEGLLFTSHSSSRKGREFATTACASGVLYWRETSQQIVVTGPVKPVSAAESDALWAARPIAAQAVSTASDQSAPLDDEHALRERAARLSRAGLALPRPERWSGYRLVPVAMEFWSGSPDRVHRRLRYDQTSGRWSARRLQP
jgi:pyridoxamine 5'-phosphate oxidase